MNEFLTLWKIAWAALFFASVGFIIGHKIGVRRTWRDRPTS